MHEVSLSILSNMHGVEVCPIMRCTPRPSEHSGLRQECKSSVDTLPLCEEFRCPPPFLHLEIVGQESPLMSQQRKSGPILLCFGQQESIDYWNWKLSVITRLFMTHQCSRHPCGLFLLGFHSGCAFLLVHKAHCPPDYGHELWYKRPEGRAHWKEGDPSSHISW